MDWSGDATEAGQRRRIVMASWRKGDVTIATGFTREEAATRLLAEAANNPSLVVGLDFAFSFPAWWVRAQGCANVFALWALAASEGERWLSDGRPPFWGRPGQPRPADHHAPDWHGFRRTDRLPAIAAKSPFQIGGAGAVGTGSIRGMPMLARLQRAGFHIWPFQLPVLPLVLEIYPRFFTGPVIKTNPAARAQYLRRPRFENLSREVLQTAAASEDAFDALCSVLGMVERAEHLEHLTTAGSEDERLEGAIWRPER